MVAAMIRTVFAQGDAKAASEQWRKVADNLRPKFRKLAELMDAAEHDVLAFMAFPKEHWAKLYSTNPIERLNAEVKRRTDVVGIFPNEAAILRLVGAIPPRAKNFETKPYRKFKEWGAVREMTHGNAEFSGSSNLHRRRGRHGGRPEADRSAGPGGGGP